MRDIKRIEKITNLLAQYWSMNPDLRFWQMIELLKSQMNDENGQEDQFYTEDVQTEIVLNKKLFSP